MGLGDLLSLLFQSFLLAAKDECWRAMRPFLDHDGFRTFIYRERHARIVCCSPSWQKAVGDVGQANNPLAMRSYNLLAVTPHILANTGTTANKA
eukprot:2882874-Amphidinium_carterae.3